MLFRSATQWMPDLILLDMKMLVMDGYTASVRLRENEKIQHIPIIAITASAMKEDEEKIRDICNSYLRKPVSRTDLVLEIMKFIPHEIDKDRAGITPIVPDPGGRLSSDTLSQFPGMAGELRTLAARCQQLSQGMAIDEIESFAQGLELLGQTNKCDSLVGYAQNLYQLALQFDMDQIKRALSDFDNLINGSVPKKGDVS